ncbi:MAG: hypothetical protein JST01_16735 [Cyanobacteria bacterium SZAS TMP-1]|nr:hypothetical protein [Cyanobacteria bacterium SZAS TMP-1]
MDETEVRALTIAVKEQVKIDKLLADHQELVQDGPFYVGDCPFCDARPVTGNSQSGFRVIPEFESYCCYGCGECGDIFSFVQRTNGLSFLEAVQSLADRYRIAPTNDSGPAPEI